MAQSDLWGYDKIQFARLLAEADAAGVFAEQSEPFQLMCESMDLSADGVRNIIHRARVFWETYNATGMRPRERPMTVAEARAIADEDNFITGVVTIEVDDLVEGDLESALDRLGEALVVGGDLMTEISQTVVGIEVSGDASLVFEAVDDGSDEDEAEEDEEDDDEDHEGKEYRDVHEECYYNDVTVCGGGLWMCETCHQDYCTEHWHDTDKGHNVECVACERERKEKERAETE
jgi:hypothetical protein